MLFTSMNWLSFWSYSHINRIYQQSQGFELHQCLFVLLNFWYKALDCILTNILIPLHSHIEKHNGKEYYRMCLLSWHLPLLLLISSLFVSLLISMKCEEEFVDWLFWCQHRLHYSVGSKQFNSVPQRQLRKVEFSYQALCNWCLVHSLDSKVNLLWFKKSLTLLHEEGLFQFFCEFSLC